MAGGRHLKIDILPYLSEKSSDFHEILYTVADFELDECQVIKNEKSCIGQTPSSTERISCYIYFFHYTLRLLRCCVSPVGCATVIVLFVDNGECSFQRRSVDLLRSERANRFLSHFPLINCSCSTEKFADKIVSLIF